MAHHREATRRHIQKLDSVNVKNRTFCPSAGRQKLAFDTERKAERFMSFLNPDDFKDGNMPQRAYYCNACVKYHVTSQVSKRATSPTNSLQALLLAEAGI